jgi:NMD protein affecting ribosome stability and mRNA decay
MGRRIYCEECNNPIKPEVLVYCEKCGVPLHEWCAMIDELNICLCKSCDERMREEIERESKEFQEYLDELEENYDDYDDYDD